MAHRSQAGLGRPLPIFLRVFRAILLGGAVEDPQGLLDGPAVLIGRPLDVVVREVRFTHLSRCASMQPHIRHMSSPLLQSRRDEHRRDSVAPAIYACSSGSGPRVAGRPYLRVCANTDRVPSVLDSLPVSAERIAAIRRGRPGTPSTPNACVSSSHSPSASSVSDLSTRVGCRFQHEPAPAVLRRAGLVTSRRDGNTILYRLTDHKVLEAYRLIQDIAR